jgi:ferrous iron transport protein B
MSEPIESILAEARKARERLESDNGGKWGGVHDRITEATYARASEIARAAVRITGKAPVPWDLIADKVLTSRLLGFPIMIVGLGVVLWMTIAGANVPSKLLASGFFWLHDQLVAGMNTIGAPWWLTGFLFDGVYLGLAWVVSVMLPPMAIFFPLFTLLEDVGYLPRVAFNLDRFFRWAGAHGKQSLTMSMGFGCNAAGVIACRIIESPRERLLAIVTNNFTLCNGRWPTIIMLSSVFVAASLPPFWSGVAATACVAGVALLGVIVTLVVCKVLSNTVLKGEASHFYLELPPYRMPNVLRVIHRSILDRTIYVLGRAVVMAAPAGGLIWLLGNITVADQSLMAHAAGALDPFGNALGMDGIILLAFIIAIPANEIVVPTIIMGYLAAGAMTELDPARTGDLFHANGWTLLTAVSTMLFSLLHYPCSTTTWTIWRETGSKRVALWSNLLPLGLAVVVCAAVAGVWRLVT